MPEEGFENFDISLEKEDVPKIWLMTILGMQYLIPGLDPESSHSSSDQEDKASSAILAYTAIPQV